MSLVNVFMRWLSYITPLEIIKVNSPLNGEIKVVEGFGKRTLLVNGTEQSGGTITNMWGKTIKRIKNYELNLPAGKAGIKNCLVLGLGGGTIIDLLNNHYPNLEITVIEFDLEIINIAKSSFGILPSKNLKIIHADAFSWIKKAINKYDLVIFDLYLGKLNPEKSRTHNFLKDLKKITHTSGTVIFNGHYQANEKEYNILLDECHKVFKQVELILSVRYSRILQLR